ncbi:sigma-70 family RNA polymerase sigma factor [Paenibacillus sp. GCM10027627]|uniref:sigma-70 family RNA polymerase sigma factor n=1 Tax=unclassified Paenibacillus TaxID=185978 RepID=UPI00362703CB
MDNEGPNEGDIRRDEQALWNRIEREKGKLYGIAYAYMRNEEDALEAIQETVCRVWIKRRTLREDKYFATWMVRILIHVCMDERKKKKRERPTPASLLEREAPRQDPAERIGMAGSVAKLPPNLRMVVALKYYRDMTITEIADLLEKPDGTIKTWLHKGLKLLKKEMEAGEEEAHHETFLAKGWERG